MADTWTLVNGYTSSDYEDTLVFEVNSDDKTLEPLKGQTLVAGEKNSQYIKFEMDRYWDGIDVSSKNISIVFSLAGTYFGTSEAVSAEITDARLRFGWVVPEEACCISGILLFELVLEEDEYVLKTQVAETRVIRSLDESSVIPEPTKEAWYTEFKKNVENDLARARFVLDTANSAISTARRTISKAGEAAEVAEEAKNDAQNAAEEARINYGSPLIASSSLDMIDKNRVYVYVGTEARFTSGNWYYHNGTEWVSGGVYKSEGIPDEVLSEKVDNWLDDHPEATTTVLDDSITTEKLKNQSVTAEKLAVSLFKPLSFPKEYVTFDGLMDLSVSSTYAAFDVYVDKGILTKKVIGYGSSSASGTDATEDPTLPIYMYSFRNPMALAPGYVSNSYAKPILLSNAMHGNEKMGVPVMLTMIKAYEDGSDAQIVKMFNDFGFDFIPILNPYGYDQAIGTTMVNVKDNPGRLNARGVDLNRNGVICWSGFDSNYKGPAPLSECESKILHDLIVTNGSNYSFFMDIHTENYNWKEHNYFGVLGASGSMLRSIFSVIMSNMDTRMKNEYEYDMSEELGDYGITAILNRSPMHFLDRSYLLDTTLSSCLYEAPRYNEGVIYPVKTQKFTSDILINFLITTVNFLKVYRPLNGSIERAYLKSKILQNDILPTTKDGWEYGFETGSGEADSTYRIRTVNRIPVSTYTYYDVVPSYDNLYYSIVLSNSTYKKYIDWTHGTTRIYTDGFTHIRINLSKGNPSDATPKGINLPELWSDYDIVVKKTELTDADISSSISSSVATVDMARMQKIGKLVVIALRITLTSNVAANTNILSGLPLDFNNYRGLNGLRLYDYTANASYDGYVTHDTGNVHSDLRCISALTNGHSIRGTAVYLSAN